MSEADLFEVIRAANAAIVALYGQVISVNFAMVVAIYYFLNRSGRAVKALAYAVYLIGMLMFLSLMVGESNSKAIAVHALGEIPPGTASAMTQGLLVYQASWLSGLTTVLLNLGLLVMVAAVTVLLFVWKRPPDIRDDAPNRDHAPVTKGVTPKPRATKPAAKPQS